MQQLWIPIFPLKVVFVTVLFLVNCLDSICAIWFTYVYAAHDISG